jgi:hypothetical protein
MTTSPLVRPGSPTRLGPVHEMPAGEVELCGGLPNPFLDDE